MTVHEISTAPIFSFRFLLNRYSFVSSKREAPVSKLKVCRGRNSFFSIRIFVCFFFLSQIGDTIIIADSREQVRDRLL